MYITDNENACVDPCLACLWDRIFLQEVRDALPGLRSPPLRQRHEAEAELQGCGEALERQSKVEKGALPRRV